MQPLFIGWTSGRCLDASYLAVDVCFSSAPATCFFFFFFLEWVKKFSRRKKELRQCLLLAL